MQTNDSTDTEFGHLDMPVRDPYQARKETLSDIPFQACYIHGPPAAWMWMLFFQIMLLLFPSILFLFEFSLWPVSLFCFSGFVLSVLSFKSLKRGLLIPWSDTLYLVKIYPQDNKLGIDFEKNPECPACSLSIGGTKSALTVPENRAVFMGLVEATGGELTYIYKWLVSRSFRKEFSETFCRELAGYYTDCSTYMHTPCFNKTMGRIRREDIEYKDELDLRDFMDECLDEAEQLDYPRTVVHKTDGLPPSHFPELESPDRFEHRLKKDIRILGAGMVSGLIGLKLSDGPLVILRFRRSNVKKLHTIGLSDGQRKWTKEVNTNDLVGFNCEFEGEVLDKYDWFVWIANPFTDDRDILTFLSPDQKPLTVLIEDESSSPMLEQSIRVPDSNGSDYYENANHTYTDFDEIVNDKCEADTYYELLSPATFSGPQDIKNELGDMLRESIAMTS